MTHPAINRRRPGSGLNAPEGCVGYGVYDPLGQRIGEAEKIFVNGDDEPEYIRVRMGLFGRKSVLIPVQSVAIDVDHRAITLE